MVLDGARGTGVTAQPNAGAVEVFTQAHCSSCREIERYLHGRGVVFTVRNVDAEPAALEEISARGYMTTPVTRIGEQWIAGYKRRALDRALKAIEC